jgi:DNA repair protein RecN (Recombination protein N)
LLTGEGQSLEALEAAYDSALTLLQPACDQLTTLRRTAAKALEESLITELKPLAMERVQFRVDIQAMEPTANGADQVQFLFSPNPGEPLQPLAETASGGEMSRFLLALKAALSQVDIVNTLVFDEVDVGVSGRVAQAIAEKLFHLGRSQQVLCVTHQPMVAALADAHFRVGKEIIELTPQTKGRRSKAKTAEATAPEQVRTVVRVMPLDRAMRRDELAQLVGGQTHQEALTFADALLQQAETLRQAYSAETARH